MEKGMHEGHRDRLKDRFIREGLESFEPHNVLELLLFYSDPRKDTNELAHKLIDRFGSLSEVLNASVKELMKVDGVGKHTAVLLSMMPQLFRVYAEDQAEYGGMATHGQIGEYICSKFTGETVEKVLIVCMDNRFRVLGTECIAEGCVDYAAINVRLMMDTVIRYNATAAIIAHNHPRGFAFPSKEDEETTLKVKQALEIVGVRLIDHIIVSADDYVSMVCSERYRDIF